MPDTRFLKPGQKVLPIQKLVALGKAQPDMAPMGEPTIRKAYEITHAFLKFCTSKRWLKSNTAAEIAENPKIRKRRKSEKRQGLKPAELRSLLDAVEMRFGQDADETWLVYVLAHSGSSTEEIAQLARTNVRHEQGLWVLDINSEDGRKTKNDNRWRTVPIHPRLIERGFTDFATKGKGQRVFMSLERDTKGYVYGNVSRRIIHVLRTQLGIMDRRKVLYSVRHAFHTATRGVVPYDIQQALVGHAEANQVHGDYGETPLAWMAHWIAKVDPLAE